MKRMKKIVAKILATVMALSVCMTNGMLKGSVVEASVSVITMTELNNRLNYICGQLEGKVFGVNQNAGCGYKSTNPNHNYEYCSNCMNYNVFEAEWFKSAFGSVSTSQVPTYAVPGGGTMSQRADSCAGFASFAEWALFNNNQDSVSTYKVGEGSFTYDYMNANARYCDIIRIRDMYHSAIVLGVSPDGCYVLDCNWTDGGTYPNSTVRRHVIGWDSSDVVAISRVDCSIINGNNPKGVLDAAGCSSPGTVWVKGWAFDDDDSGRSIDVHIYVGGNSGNPNAESFGFNANVSSNDVNQAYGISGNHRFLTTLKTSKSGTQEVYAYAINIGSGENVEIGHTTVNITPDTEKPVISNAKITEVTETSYTIELDATDNVGIKRVAFPTWVSYKTSEGCTWYKPTSSSGNHYTFKLPYTDFNKYQGKYNTHAYAYDYAGNKECINFNYTALKYAAQASTTIGNKRYELYNTNCSRSLHQRFRLYH